MILNTIINEKITNTSLLLLFISCYNVEHLIAKALKPVKFSFEYRVDGVKTTVFERIAWKLKMETDTASIRWINDCEYILKNYTQKHGRKSQ
jgi:hypothetical protein